MKYIKYVIFKTIKLLSLIFSKVEDKNENYLFVNTGQIGDLVVSSLILENDDYFKDLNCFLLIDSKYRELFQEYKGPINIISFNKNKYRYNLIYRLRILKRIRNLNIDITFNITAARGFINDELTLLSGAKKHFATCSNHKYLGSYAGKRFDSKYEGILFQDIKNEYDKTINLIYNITRIPKNYIKFKNNNTFCINKNLINKEYIAISPFTTNPLKSWYVDNYRYVIVNLSKFYNVIILGSENQKKKLNELKKGLPNVEFILCSLSEAAQIIYHSRLFIGNDSGLTHIAYKLEKKLIAIIGGMFFGSYFPYSINENITHYFYNKMDCFGCQGECRYDKPYCIIDVDKDKVLELSLRLMNNY